MVVCGGGEGEGCVEGDGMLLVASLLVISLEVDD
jgi:hypothetical protein